MLFFSLWLFSVLAWALPDLDPNQKYNYTSETWLNEIYKTHPLIPCIDTQGVSFLHPLKELISLPATSEQKSNTSKKEICGWFSVSFDEIADDGAQFEISTYIDAEGYYPIVGDSKKWPLNVKRNGINIIVSELDSQPYIYLDRGEAIITGSFSWNELPPYVQVPEHFFISPNKKLKNSVREDNFLYFHKDKGTENFDGLHTIHHVVSGQPNICNNIYVFSGYTGDVQISLPEDEILDLVSIFPYSIEKYENKVVISIPNVYGHHAIQIRQTISSLSSYFKESSIELEDEPKEKKTWLILDRKAPFLQISAKGLEHKIVSNVPEYLDSFLERSNTLLIDDNSRQTYFIENTESIELVHKQHTKSEPSSNYMKRYAWWNPSRQNWQLYDYIRAKNLEDRLYTTELEIEEIQGNSGFLLVNTFPRTEDNENIQIGTEVRSDQIEIVIKASTKDILIPNSGCNIQFDETDFTRFIPKDHKVISLYALDDWKVVQIILCMIAAMLTPQISFLQRCILGGVLCSSIYTQAPWIVVFVLVGILMRIDKDWCKKMAHMLIWMTLMVYAFIEIDTARWDQNLERNDVVLSEKYDNPYHLLHRNASGPPISNVLPNWSHNRIVHSIRATDQYHQEIILSPKMWFPIFVFHLCLLLYVFYRFYDLEIPNFSKKKEVLLILFTFSFASEARAESLMGYELEQMKNDFFKGHCEKNCSTTSFMRIDTKDNQLIVTAEVHVNKRTFWNIPGPEEQWVPEQVFVDSKETTKLFRYEMNKQGHYYLLLLEEGVWEVKLVGQINQASVLTLHENSKSLDFHSSEWEIDGLYQPIQDPQSIHIYPISQQSNFDNFTSRLHLTRHIKTSPSLHITNTLKRIGERSNTEVTVHVPQYLVMPNSQEEPTTKEITIPINKMEVTWDEALPTNFETKSENPTHVYLSSDSGFYETWILECSTSHRCIINNDSINTVKDDTKQIWYPKMNQNMDVEIIDLEPIERNWRMRNINTKINTENYSDPYLRWETSIDVYSTKSQSIPFSLRKNMDCKVAKNNIDQIVRRQGNTIFIDIDKGKSAMRLNCLSPKESLYWYSLPEIKVTQELQGHILNMSPLSWLPITISKDSIKGDQKHYAVYVFLLICLSIFCAKLSFSNLRLFEWLSVLLIVLFYNYHLSMIVLPVLLVWNLMSLSATRKNLRLLMILLWYFIPIFIVCAFFYFDRMHPNFYMPYPTMNLTDKIYFLSLPFRARFIPLILISIILVRWMVQGKNYPKKTIESNISE